jgi:hypothetical protein
MTEGFFSRLDAGWAGGISRRRALGSLFVAAAGAAAAKPVSALLLETGRGRDGGHLHTRQPVPAGPTVRYPVLAADGFLPATVIGTYVRAVPPFVVLSAGSPARAVMVTIQPTTRVTAGGYRALGDMSRSKIGDELLVATLIDAVGKRVAVTVDANFRTYWGTVTNIAGNIITCQTGAYGASKWSTVTFDLAAYSQIDPSLPQVGDPIYCAATCSDAQEPLSIWPTTIQVFAQAS